MKIGLLSANADRVAAGVDKAVDSNTQGIATTFGNSVDEEIENFRKGGALS